MRIVRRFIELPGQQTLSLALGNFDGIHLGHKALLKNLDTDDNHQHAVMTFEPHPLSVLRPQIKITRLYSFREKLLYLEKSAEVIYIPRFNQALAAMTAEDFVDLLFNTLNVKRVIVGENFRFGNQQHGDTEMLRRLAKPKGVTIDTIPLINIDGDSVSSGRIRQCLSEGNFTQAASLLGREWTLSGKVRKGRGLGRQLGTPTANIHLSFTPPCRGIFAATATWDGGKPLPAAISIGNNPTVNSGNDKLYVEAHIPNFDGELYGCYLHLQPIKKIRDEQKYENLAKLKKAIAEDIKQTLSISHP